MKGHRLIFASLIIMLAGCTTIGNGNSMKEYFVVAPVVSTQVFIWATMPNSGQQ